MTTEGERLTLTLGAIGLKNDGLHPLILHLHYSLHSTCPEQGIISGYTYNSICYSNNPK
jgi:hypothetical protein